MRCVISLIVLFALSPAVRADELRGRVISVADGDTITILDANKEQHKVRLLHIDAPESKQAYGVRAREHLAALVFGKDVVVKWSQRDRYQRILGEVSVGGTNANLDMVKAGLAWHYKADMEYAAAEEAARKAKRGLWADKNPVPPWEFRKKN